MVGAKSRSKSCDSNPKTLSSIDELLTAQRRRRRHRKRFKRRQKAVSDNDVDDEKDVTSGSRNVSTKIGDIPQMAGKKIDKV